MVSYTRSLLLPFVCACVLACLFVWELWWRITELVSWTLLPLAMQWDISFSRWENWKKVGTSFAACTHQCLRNVGIFSVLIKKDQWPFQDFVKQRDKCSFSSSRKWWPFSNVKKRRVEWPARMIQSPPGVPPEGPQCVGKLMYTIITLILAWKHNKAFGVWSRALFSKMWAYLDCRPRCHGKIRCYARDRVRPYFWIHHSVHFPSLFLKAYEFPLDRKLMNVKKKEEEAVPFNIDARIHSAGNSKETWRTNENGRKDKRFRSRITGSFKFAVDLYFSSACRRLLQHVFYTYGNALLFDDFIFFKKIRISCPSRVNVYVYEWPNNPISGLAVAVASQGCLSVFCLLVCLPFCLLTAVMYSSRKYLSITADGGMSVAQWGHSFHYFPVWTEGAIGCLSFISFSISLCLFLLLMLSGRFDTAGAGAWP